MMKFADEIGIVEVPDVSEDADDLRMRMTMAALPMKASWLSLRWVSVEEGILPTDLHRSWWSLAC